jgi:hypothetical protein
MNDDWKTLSTGTQLVVAITTILGGIIVALSLYYFFVTNSVAKDVFEDVVVQTLLPIFNTLIMAVLTWVFGKPIVAALAQRIATKTRDAGALPQ